MSEVTHPQTDLADRADVEVLLRRFYGRIFDDATLDEPFAELRVKGLDSHLPVMCDFWETVLFRAGLYHGNALLVHRQLDSRHPLCANHFARWLTLWNATLDEMYRGPVAERAKVQAGRIAQSMHRRLRGIDATEPIPIGTTQVRMEFVYDGGGMGKGGDVTLYCDGKEVSNGRVDRTQGVIFSADETTDVGRETGTTVSPDYTAHTSKFSGKFTGCRSIWARTLPTPTTTSTRRNASGLRWRDSRSALQ